MNEQNHSASVSSNKPASPWSAKAPWKRVDISIGDASEMLLGLRRIRETVVFGPLLPTTAKDILAAARVSVPTATPADVLEFVTVKLLRKNSLQQWGDLLIALYEEFGQWQAERQRLRELACPYCGCPRLSRYGTCAACGRSREVAQMAAERCAAERDCGTSAQLFTKEQETGEAEKERPRMGAPDAEASLDPEIHGGGEDAVAGNKQTPAPQPVGQMAALMESRHQTKFSSPTHAVRAASAADELYRTHCLDTQEDTPQSVEDGRRSERGIRNLPEILRELNPPGVHLEAGSKVGEISTSTDLNQREDLQKPIGPLGATAGRGSHSPRPTAEL